MDHLCIATSSFAVSSWNLCVSGSEILGKIVTELFRRMTLCHGHCYCTLYEFDTHA